MSFDEAPATITATPAMALGIATDGFDRGGKKDDLALFKGNR